MSGHSKVFECLKIFALIKSELGIIRKGQCAYVAMIDKRDVTMSRDFKVMTATPTWKFGFKIFIKRFSLFILASGSYICCKINPSFKKLFCESFKTNRDWLIENWFSFSHHKILLHVLIQNAKLKYFIAKNIESYLFINEKKVIYNVIDMSKVFLTNTCVLFSFIPTFLCSPYGYQAFSVVKMTKI